jgi:nicotinamidase-related amidase
MPIDRGQIKLIDSIDELFDTLDLNKSGELSRSELHVSARRMGWHWKQAPLLAVLDLLAVPRPISRNNFISYMNQIVEDPQGPFGKVLLNARHFSAPADSKTPDSSDSNVGAVNKTILKKERSELHDPSSTEMISLLKRITHPEVANNYQKFLENKGVEKLKIKTASAALLVIDPQKSFTQGAWMKSIGPEGKREVKPIRLAFDTCARWIHKNCGRIETMFTRCPFPPGSYDWDDAFTGIIDRNQLYFIKPGNSVLYPATNGFREWVERILDNDKTILVMAGCTLNSCVRKSSIETQKYFEDRKLRVVVDLSMCGARTANFTSSILYAGLSAVESAVREMMDAGVLVAESIQWI